MRKPLIPALALSLLLSACGGAPEAAAPAAPQDGALPPVSSRSTSLAAPPEALDFVLETAVYEDAAQLEDGTVLARFRYEVPVLRVEREGAVLDGSASPQQQRALDTAAAFNGGFAAWTQGQDFAEHAKWAREDYEERPELFENGGFYQDLLTCTAYQTPRLVSIRGDYQTYTGGAHGNTALMAWNFDLERGVFFSAADLSDDPLRFVQAVAGELEDQMERRAEAGRDPDGSSTELVFWEDRADIAAQWTSYAVSFSPEGMAVGFSPYELAPYAAGAQVFTVEYSFLQPFLNEAGRELLELPGEG